MRESTSEFVNLPGQQCSVAVILFQCGKEMLQSGHQSPAANINK